MDKMLPTNISNNTDLLPLRNLPSKAEGIAFCSVVALEALLIVLGNTLMVALFALNKTLQKKTFYLVVNMAVADLILGAVIMPSKIYLHFGPAYLLWTPKPLSFYFNLFVSVTVIVFLQGSFLSAFAITVERFFAIHWPLQHRTLSGRPYCVVIFVVWTLSITFSVISSMLNVLFSTEIQIYFLASYVLILLFIVCCCNIGIWRKFQHRMIATQQQNRALQGERLTKTLLFVSVVALLSWLPFLIGVYLGFTSSAIFIEAYDLTLVLLYCNSVFNPVVYALRIPEFKKALRLCCFRRQVAVDMKENGRKNNRVEGLVPETQLETLSIDMVGNISNANRTL